MPAIYAEAGQIGPVGQAGSPASAETLKDFGIRGNVAIGIRDGFPRPQWKWYPDPTPSLEEPESNEPTYSKSGASCNIIDFEQGTDQAQRNFLSSYGSRIKYLINEAAQDGYGLNSDSEADFWQFVRSTSNIREGDLVLVDNGNLRAIWKDKHNLIGLQFLGGGMVQYVIFRQRAPEKPMSRVAGRDSFEGVLLQINALDLGVLLYQ